MASSRKRPRADLPGHLARFLHQHVPPGSRVLLGLSGGLDSRVLLHLLLQARGEADFTLSAVHVNHGISPHAASWADFCAELCDQAGIPFQAVEVKVARDSGLGLEAAAREARYRVLLAQPCDATVLAHHQDDQAETLLLQLLRGAGVKGLSAMGMNQPRIVSLPADEEQTIPEKILLRPLLDIPRSALETYAREHQLDWIEDESNLDLAYDRNFLRHHIFPELEKRFPSCRATLARSASHLAEAAELLEQIARADAEQGVREGRLELGLLKSFTFERAINLLRWWIAAETGLAASTAQLRNVWSQLCEAQENARVECSLGAVTVRRYRDQAYIERDGDLRPYRIEWDGGESIVLPDGSRLLLHKTLGDGIALARISKPLMIASRTGGERLRLSPRRPTRSLKNLWQEAGIPPWERERMPFVWHGDDLVAAVGLGVACEWQAQPGEPGLTAEWLKQGL